MAIKESVLTTISSITGSDFVRAVTSAGASRRITVSNLAKHIAESYTGSTIAGAAQSIKAAVDGIYNKAFKLNELYASATINNPDNAALYTWYLAYTSGTNIPDQGMLYTYGSNTIKFQVLHAQNATYLRRYGSSAWSDWSKAAAQPIVSGTSDIGGTYRLHTGTLVKPSISFTVASNSRHLLVFTGPYMRGHAVYTVACNASGYVYAIKIGGTEDFVESFSGQNNTLLITNSAAADTYCAIEDVVITGTPMSIA